MSETLTLPAGWQLEDGASALAHPSAAAIEAYGGATILELETERFN